MNASSSITSLSSFPSSTRQQWKALQQKLLEDNFLLLISGEHWNGHLDHP